MCCISVGIFWNHVLINQSKTHAMLQYLDYYSLINYICYSKKHKMYLYFIYHFYLLVGRSIQNQMYLVDSSTIQFIMNNSDIIRKYISS